MNYNSKIKVLRKKHGDTLKQLAQRINYDYSNLSKVERGIYEPSLDLLLKVAEVYNVDMNYFFKTDNDNTYEDENKLLKELDISCNQSKKKFELLLDGKQISKKELEFAIEVLRKLRSTLDSTR
ncbi:transcriptional regulator with XRE-family HTH domain [Neobacillus niacini]|jgi:transcriptional regulator with XRE-family HTH domain|uniref:helix-turn-helix domain-containing protein n=1 Tax=Neobacillus niacini TaxID=86668 RepID=UPI002782CAB4|nr:helix-turn-helix transcriptional regulator [Neobacillus niacini]MDQ1003596.1 transcriptional regulator with XRE-family HTH domain [Neobacillus niacini]